MKVIQYEEPYSSAESIPEYYNVFYPNSRILFIDIETTGFAAKNTTLYLIGVLWYEKDYIHILQWFNDDGYSEKEILTAFFDFCKEFTHLLHYNGLGFDIPYLKQKSDILQMSFPIDKELTHIDIYKEIRCYKHIFALEHMKQISIEKYLGINRQDTYGGKELIHIYQRYVAKPDAQKEQLLLLHNHDDLLGMTKISQILNYKAFFEAITIQNIRTKIEDSYFIITFTYSKTAYLPRRISVSHSGFYLNALGQKAVLSVPIFEGTLKHFFADYKNYYYLPAEDMAIHKSIAAFVESQNKERAVKNNCYIKKTDCFIPCMNKNYTEPFQINPSDKAIYQTLDSIYNNNISAIKDYIQKSLFSFLK